MNQYKKQHHNLFSLWILVMLLFFCVFVQVRAQYLTSPNFQIENPTISIGGGSSSSLSFQHIASLGEFVIGSTSSLNFSNLLGFLYFFDAEEEIIIPNPNSGGGSSGSILKPEVLKYVLDPDHNICKIADFNCDSRVNILDLSILLYYMTFNSSEIRHFDLNSDNKIDLIDASIMFYYWDE